MVRKLRGLFFKIWYWYISSIDKNAEVIFMNFGYSNTKENLVLNENDEKNRYSIQLYHHIATGVDVGRKRILEVGCGRGGGLSYLARYLQPESVVGIDLNAKAVKFCKEHYKETNVRFIQGDAQELPFADDDFDIVLNVESSHRYPNTNVFFSEVRRVLKPGGYFLFADFRNKCKVDELDSQLKESGLQVESREDITENVVKALTLANPDREKMIKKLAPRFLHELCRNFAATVGSPVYKKFSSKELVYLNYVLRN
ncbi:MAG: class I SAM-dependent methyltransferase [Bacteroidales bacterium]